jgi:hypothetical protein
MQGTAVRIVAALLLSFTVACTTTLEISRDERADFSAFRTWDWLPDTARSVEAPTPEVAAGLDYDLARLIHSQLAQQGFEQVRRGPDLRIGFLLNVQRQVVTYIETGASQQLSSLHDSPSYEIQASTERVKTYDHARLVVFAIDPRSRRVVWQGVLQDRFDGALSAHLKGTVASLLEHFPPAGRAARLPIPGREPATPGPSEFTGPPSRSEPDVSS